MIQIKFKMFFLFLFKESIDSNLFFLLEFGGIFLATPFIAYWLSFHDITPGELRSLPLA